MQTKMVVFLVGVSIWIIFFALNYLRVLQITAPIGSGCLTLLGVVLWVCSLLAGLKTNKKR